MRRPVSSRHSLCRVSSQIKYKTSTPLFCSDSLFSREVRRSARRVDVWASPSAGKDCGIQQELESRARCSLRVKTPCPRRNAVPQLDVGWRCFKKDRHTRLRSDLRQGPRKGWTASRSTSWRCAVTPHVLFLNSPVAVTSGKSSR